MDESSIKLSLFDHEYKEIHQDKNLVEKEPVFKFTEDFKDYTIESKAKDAGRLYIDKLLKSLDDKEHISVPFERVKEKIAALLGMEERGDDYVPKLMEAADALDAFLDTHQGTYFWSYKKARKANVLKLKEAVNSMLEQLKQDMEDKLPENEDEVPTIEIPSPERIKQAEAGVKELAKHMGKWRKRIGDYLLNTPEETIKWKLSLYEAYLDDITIYRQQTYLKDMPNEYRELIADYDSLKLRADLIELDKKEGHASYYKNESMELAEGVALNLDEELVNKKAIDKEYDKDLTSDQAAGIQSIDRWMIRNFSNGGVVGLVVERIENAQEAFVQKILSLSKRERLYLYYMVETKARKTASISEMVKSQEYVPSLSEFKNQMLATKFKITKHFTGGYVYWHKLTEAMQRLNGQGDMLESFLKGRKAFKEEEEKKKGEWLDKEEEEEKEENIPDAGSFEAISKSRVDGLKSFHRGLNELADAMRKKRPKKEIERIRRNVDKSYEELVKNDEKIGKLINGKDYQGQVFYKKVEAVSYVAMGTGYSKTAVSNSPTIMANTAGLFWNVRSWNWVPAQKGIEITAGSLGSLTTFMGVVGGIIALSYFGASTSAMDLTEQIAELTTTVASLGVGIWKAVEAVSLAKDTAEMFMKGLSYTSTNVAYTPLQKTGVGLAAVNLGIAAVKGVTAINHHCNLKDAKAFYKTRDKAALEQLEKNKGLLSGTEKERKAQKEARFHKNIAKLSEAEIKQKRDSAIFAGVIGVTALATAIFPELAVLGLAVMGVGMALGFVQKGVKVKKNSNTNYRAFDDYFNVDEIYNRVLKNQTNLGRVPNFDAMEKKDPKVAAKKRAEYENLVKKNIRRQLSAAYGFSNVWGTRIYIANQYAEYIRSVLYPPEGSERPKEDDVKAMTSLIKSMGLKVNREKDLPTVYQIRLKLSGGR